MTAAVETHSHFIAGAAVTVGPTNDAPQFAPVLLLAALGVTGDRVRADAAFDSEAHHRFAREGLGIRSSVIPINPRGSDAPPKGRYRSPMPRHFRPRAEGNRHKRVFGQRWQVETTFQEARTGLGLETTRGWREKTVLRAAPCLLGLYTVVALLFHALPEAKRVGAVSWPGKAAVTFSDARCAVRRWLGAEAVLPQVGADAALDKLPIAVRELLLITLAPAA